MKRWLLILCSASSLITAWGQPQPDSLRAARWTARTQVAGMQGLVSAGALWNPPDGRLQLGALYGFAPAANGAQAFHALVLRVTGALLPLHQPVCGRWTFSPVLSLSMLADVSGTTWLVLPEEFPDGYYGPNGLHGLLGVGGRVGRTNACNGWALTLETVALDTPLWYAISQSAAPFHEAWSLAVGFEYHF